MSRERFSNVSSEEAEVLYAQARRVVFGLRRSFKIGEKFCTADILRTAATTDPDLSDAISIISKVGDGVNKVGHRLAALLRNLAGQVFAGVELQYAWYGATEGGEFWFELPKVEPSLHNGAAPKRLVQGESLVSDQLPLFGEEAQRALLKAIEAQTATLVETITLNTTRLLDAFDRAWGAKK